MAAVQDVKAIVENLKADNRPEATENEVTFEAQSNQQLMALNEIAAEVARQFDVLVADGVSGVDSHGGRIHYPKK